MKSEPQWWFFKKIYLDTNLLKENKMEYACKIHTTLAMDSFTAWSSLFIHLNFFIGRIW